MDMLKSMARKVDGSPLKGAREIFNMQTTFVNGTNSNARVLDKASKHAYPDPGYKRRVKLISMQQNGHLNERLF